MRIAVIPARGGSKRFPRKNLRLFRGKPMIVHSIDLAISSGLFDRIVVSTDDEEIARVAESRAAEVPFIREAALSDDHATTTAVVADAIVRLSPTSPGMDAVCCIYPTAPLLRVADLRAGLDVLMSGTWAYVFSATRFDAPVHRAFELSGSGAVRMLFPKHFNTRTQDLPAVYHDAAQFYWGRPAAWIDQLRLFAEHSTAVLIPQSRVQDVDTEEDWARLERIAEVLDRQDAGR